MAEYRSDQTNSQETPRQFLWRNVNELLNLSKSKLVAELITNISAFVLQEMRPDKPHNSPKPSTHQLRNMYSEVRKAKDAIDVQMLRPQLAYIAARQPEAKNIIIFFDEIAQKVTNEAQVAGFIDFFEAVVAYHKFHFPKS